MKKTLTSLLVCVLLQSVLLLARPEYHQPSNSVAFTHVTIIDGTGAQPKPDQTVVITGNRITSLGRTGQVKVPQGAQTVDATGKFLIPGLADMHVHLWHERWEKDLPVNAPANRDVFLNLFLPNGITSVRNMGGDIKVIGAWRKEIAQGTRLGPRITAAGPIIDGPNKTREDYISVSTPDEARRIVRDLQQQGVDFIKVYSNLPRDAYFALADECRRRHLPFAGHLPTLITAEEASRAGQRSLEHIAWLPVSCSIEEKALREEQLQARMTRSNDGARLRQQRKRQMATYSPAKAAMLFRELRENGTWICPTLRVPELFRWRDDRPFFGDPRIKYIPQWMQKRLSTFDLRQGIPDDEFAFRQPYHRYLMNIVGDMHRAGLRLLAGTDTLYLNFPGWGLHEELALLVEAGLTPMEALQSATINPARFLGRDKDLGTVERGKLADLVLLDANPLTDIRNTMRINAVVVNGRLLNRTRLNTMLDEVEVAARMQ